MDRKLSAYQAALDFLFVRTTAGARFGLERTEALLKALGDPHRRLRAFHVAGTNGKGSTCATLEAILRARGLRVGKYTSPHLVDFRERIVVDGVPIPEDAVVEWVGRWSAECERLGATFFEATTAMAFDHFAAMAVDVAVIEVGLGGRLDSTTVLSPVAAGVTSIGIDHADYLGETPEAIAAEKAGIFKAGVPAVVGERDSRIRTVLLRAAVRTGATPVVDVPRAYALADVAVTATGTRFTLARGDEVAALRTPLLGAYQAANASVAIALLDAAGPPWRVGQLADVGAALGRVSLPGRFDRRGRWLFDVAHNPDGAVVLAETLARLDVPPPVSAVLTVLADKDWRGIMRALAPAVTRFVLTRAPTAPPGRAWQPEDALAFAGDNGWDAVLEPDFDRALAIADGAGGTALVTGSFHTVGDAMARLQLNPLGG